MFVSVVLPELTVYSQGEIIFLNVKRVTCKYVAAYTKKFQLVTQIVVQEILRCEAKNVCVGSNLEWRMFDKLVMGV